MKCNLKECYWNMWTPKHEMLNNNESMVCVSERFNDHYDEESEFKLTPNDERCLSYLNYLDFCGREKGE
ncbi:hypothetical protein ABMB67_001525 [Halalkalibacter oceani]